MKTIRTILLVIMVLASLKTLGQSHAGQRAGKGAGQGAWIGAVAGAVLGDGDFLGDAVGGALIGSGVGALTGAIKGGKQDRVEKERYQALVARYGEDNLRGYVALLNRDHDKAIALFGVGQTSSNRQHRLVALWLTACAEKDRKNQSNVNKLLDQLVADDDDIDDKEMAMVAVNQLVLEMRQERRS